MRCCRWKSCLLYLFILLAFAVLVYLDSEVTWRLDSATNHRSNQPIKDIIGPSQPSVLDKRKWERFEKFSVTKRNPISLETATTSQNDSNYQRISENVEICFKMSELTTNVSFLTAAKHNALKQFNEYRKVIPRQSLPSHVSHCWHADYQISRGRASDKVQGHIDGLEFSDTLPQEWYTESALDILKRQTFSTSTVCVPNLYITGVPKCGTTFLWCFINKVLRFKLRTTADADYEKEPHFWTPYQYDPSPPNATRIASRYLLNFIRRKSNLIEKDILIDGSPNMVLEWPRFSKQESDLTNYCLLPTTMSELMPNSKFIIILRNPVDALYSAFWWSLNFLPPKNMSIAVRRKYKAPEIFHKRTLDKIDKFNLCMTDVRHPDACGLSAGNGVSTYSDCMEGRMYLLSNCVYHITVHREPYQTVLHKTIYYPHVVKWLSVLPRERLLVLSMEKLLEHPLKTAKEIVNFVKLSHDDSSPKLEQNVIENIMESCTSNPQLNIDYKQNKRLRIREDTVAVLREFFRPFNRRLAELLLDNQFVWF